MIPHKGVLSAIPFKENGMDVKNIWDSKKGLGPFWCLESKFGIFNAALHTIENIENSVICLLKKKACLIFH